jgi:hypothetical protein
MKCPCCGKEVELHDMDVAFGLPDAIFTLPEEQRGARAKTHTDLCSLDDRRYFIRGVVYVPVKELAANFGWGVWAEVSEETFHRYRDLYDKDGTNEPPAAGVLANIPPGYAEIEQPLEIHFGAPDKRPVFKPTPTESEFYHEQIDGLPVRKWHSIVERYAG